MIRMRPLSKSRFIPLGILVLLFSGLTPIANFQKSAFASAQVFSATGAAQTYVVPNNVSSLEFEVIGAGGGTSTGGKGAIVRGVISVTPGETLQINVGIRGATGSVSNAFGGGGKAGSAHATVGGGGGASDIRRGSFGLDDRIVVAGGGGAGGGAGAGGDGGYPNGAAGTRNAGYYNGYPGGGGTSTAGGAAGANMPDCWYSAVALATAGSKGNGGDGAGGGNSPYTMGSGGGGGYFGGGGGGAGCNYGAGGGGSSYIINTATSTSSALATSLGDGSVTLTPVSATPTITSLATTSGTTAGGTSVTITGTNLSGVTGITFGGSAGTSITSNTSTSVTVVTPARAAGVVDVVVTTSVGSVTSANTFTYIAAPTITATSITGTPNIGQTLTASLSLGGGTPTSTTYQWSSSDSASGTYSDISGATSSTYLVPTAQVGKFIKLTATVSNSSGSASATSSATTRVNDGLFLRYDAGNSSSYSGTGTTVNDVSGAGIGGTLSGGSSTYPGFVSTYGKSFSFNATNSQHLDIADIPAISFANGFTATAWANFGSANSFERLVDLGNGQANGNIIFGRFGTENDLFVDIWDGGNQKGYCRGTNAIQSGWAHYAVTLSGSTCVFYVNGTSVTGTNHLSIGNPVSVARTANFIGKSNWTADGYFESGIARVSLWNRALTSTEVAARATAETPGAEVVLSVNSISVARGSAITNLTSTTYGGTATSFSISPTLPTGLSFDTTNGTLSGTPTVGLSSTTYTVTANGITGSPTATFTLAVSATALSGASAPTVTATSGSSTSITVNFTSIANATSHTVRVYQNDGTTLVSTNTGFSSGGTVTGLTANTAYKVSLQAIGDGTSYSTSAESAKSSVTTNITLTNGSIAFSGSNYIWTPASSDFNFGTGDFTVEWWQKFDTANSGGAPRPWSIGVYGSSRLQVSFEAGRAYTGIGTSWVLSPSVPAAQYQNVWSHWALVRSSGVATLYLNGISIATAANSTNLDLSALKLFVGTEDPAAYSTTKFAGNITEFRIVKSAVYTSNFVPSAGVSNISNTIVLLNAKQEAFINDSSSIGRTFTNVSSASSSSSYPLVPTITSLSTTTGSTSGGTSVTISGTNLSNTSNVAFGGTAGTSISSNTSTSVTVTTPAKSAGTVDVILTTVGGSVLSAGAFTFGAAPTLTGAAISGTTSQGQTLTASIQGAGGGTATTTTYQWSRSDTSSGTYTNISGATSSTYVLTSDDVNKYVKVTISVSNSAGGPNSATSSATAQIAALLTAPTLTGAAISGTTTQGQTLTASIQGAGGGTATATTYQWSRSDSSSGTYTNINNATNSTYTLTSADVAKYIKVTISVSNSAGGPNSATSSASNQIAPIAPTLAGASFIGTTTVGQTLTATTGTLGGGPVASTTYQWKSSSTSSGIYTDIAGATNSTYVLTSNEANKYIKVTVTVSNVAGSNSATSNASAAAVISNNPTPTISSISPNGGTTAGGTSVTISGTNLSTVSAVTFDGSAATISTKTSTQLVVVTPAHSAGAVDVVVTNTAGSVTSANGFTYATTPTVRSWTATPSITSGNVNDTFTVTYRAVCTTPQRYGPSMYDLIYVNGGSWVYNSYMGSGTSTDGGYTWTITKTYTLTGTGIWKVDAYERGACWDSYNFTYAARSFINVGVSGPTITSLSVTSGPSSGGTSTTITGTNLTGVTGITVGGTAATSIRSNTSTSVTFNTPAGTAGAKNVVVTTQAGTATASNGFTYTAPITITYDVNGGSGSPSRASDSYTPNTGGYSLPVVGTMTRTGYTFSGWATANNSNTALTSPYNPTSSLTLYAIWTAISYTNSYNANGATGGTVPSSTTDAFGSTVTVAGNTGSLARTGFTLAGWNTAANGSGTSYTLGSGTFTQGAGNRTLYAEWIADTYTVSYDVNGSNDSAPTSHTNQVANSTITLAAGVTKANFAFVGWEAGGVTYKAGASFTLAAADVTMVAKWIAVYKLSYNLNGTGATGSVPADFQYASGDPINVTNVVPTRSGYTFGGWIDQSGTSHASSSTYNISSTNYLLYAVWNPIAYTVTYALNGGQGSAPTETTKNVNATFTVASAPTKTGSTFAGWSDGTRVYGAGSSYLVGTADITLTAQWTANNYAVTYDLAQGTSSVPSALSKNYQASWTLPDAPTRVGYNFADWYDGTTGYAAGASYTHSSASDLTITARWTAIVYYTVTYDLDGGLGTPPSQDPLQNGQSFTLPSDPSKTGFSFTGWSYAGTTYSSGQTITMPAANVTVTALWTATSAGTYAITYISNGAQTAAPTVPALAENATFTIDDGSGLIKNGYIFSGWSRNGTTYNGGETFTMPASSVTFSAVWVPSVRATAVSHSVDSTLITRGRSITVTYSLGCYAFSSTIPTIFENVSSTSESFINNITSSLTVIDAGYNWTVTRVYTLSYSGTYTIFATASGGCFTSSTDSTSSTVTVTEAPSNAGGGAPSTGSGTSSESNRGSTAPVGSVQPVTVVGARIALVANKNFTLPKINNATPLSVEAKAGASATSTTTTTQSNGSVLTSTTMLSVNNASKGLSEVKIVENQLAVVPAVGFSGKTDVTVTVTDGATTTTVVVPVTVLPEPVKDPVITPVAARQTTVTWEPSPNADSYQVIVDGKTACKSATDSCEIKKILGPNADVQVIANGGDATKSDAVDADYEADKTVVLTKLVGTTKSATLTQNDINMLNKVIATVKSQGFETVTISQITTTKVNAAAAKARVDALVNYVKSKSGDPDLIVKVVPAPAKTSMNQIAVK